MRDLFERILRIARSDATVLIDGETGCGKEVVAEAIHKYSPRASESFVVLDCGFTHETMIFERFTAALGGTLLLDQVGDLPLELQPSLLRAVDTTSIACNIRILAATNHPLARQVHRGTFRSDLYYRLAVARVSIPPLRERRDDIPLLVDHFVCDLTLALALGDHPAVSEEFLAHAARHAWPGNVRELRNAVVRHVLAMDHGAAVEPPPSAAVLGDVDCGVPFKIAKLKLIDEFDRKYFLGLLQHHHGNLTAAARAAGITRASIYKVIRRLGVDHRDFIVAHR